VRRLWRDERGQGMAIPTMALASIIAMTAFVVDVGSWFRADRHMQAVADATALAAAQELPGNPKKAIAVANDYATRNGGPVAEHMEIFKDRKNFDSIRVRYSQDVPGFFARFFGVDTVRVGANAEARATSLAAAKWVAPIVVSEQHPYLRCTSPGVCDPDFGTETTLDLANLHKPGSGDAAGAFGLINLQAGNKGTVGESTLAEWIMNGFDQYMETGIFNSVPSAMFNGQAFRNALAARIAIGTEMLFPIYRTLKESGSQAEYTVVGWVGFVVTDVVGGGEASKLKGYFTQVVWDGIPADESNETPDYGAFVVSLTK
jgi:hypothetical protein